MTRSIRAPMVAAAVATALVVAACAEGSEPTTVAPSTTSTSASAAPTTTAATAAMFNLSAPPRATLRVDRPFLFIIKHRSTDEVLFVGQVVDPTVGASGT